MSRKSLASLICFISMTAFSVAMGGEEAIRYSTQIAPILRTYCVSCHSRVDAQNGLSLQAPDDILTGGKNGSVLNEAAPAESLLLHVVTSSGEDHMPPVDEPQLSAKEVAMLTQWLREGARFDSRMAVLPSLPNVAVTADRVRNPVLAMTLTHDGESILSGTFRKIEQQEKSTGKHLWSLPVPDGKVNGLRLSSDGKRLLVATGTPGLSGRGIEVPLNGTAGVREFAGHNDILYAAHWSPDETIVATAGYDRRIFLHDAQTGKKLRELTGHNGAIFDLSFSPDGSLLASASADATIKVWQVATGERFDTLSQPQGEQYSVLFSPDGQFIYAGGADSRIRKWQLISKTSPQINPILISRFAHEGAISKMDISADGRFLVSASDSGSVKIWDAESVSELVAVNLENDLASSLAFDNRELNVLIATSNGHRKVLAVPQSSAMPDAASSMPEITSFDSIDDVLQNVAESEPNNAVAAAQLVKFPVSVTGTIDGGVDAHADVDMFRFDARRGQQIVIEVRAARDKSPLDSIVEVVDSEGKPILQTQLQAVRDSYFTFRGKDSDTSDDFRLFNWQEMELNEYLYADGEVVKLWLYPRGPDSGFKVYPGFGNRQTYFGTTPTSHPLQGPAFVVVAQSPTAVLKDTGLPVFPIYYQNDDDPMRQWGKDSRLIFVAPGDGAYVVRIRDARGFQGPEFRYQMTLRAPQPDFTVSMAGNELTIHKDTGREISFTATRLDGYDGPIEIVAENLPEGFTLSDPILIQDEQRQAFATLVASRDATQPTDDAVGRIQFKARARIGNKEIVHDIGGMKSLKLSEKAKILVTIHSSEEFAAGQNEQTSELTVWAGETVNAFLKVQRVEHDGLVEFGKEDSGRNMPHGVFVDNIGLNGLMLLQGQSEREFFITVAKWVPEMSRPFYLKSNVDGGITTRPVMLHIRRRDSLNSRTAAAK